MEFYFTLKKACLHLSRLHWSLCEWYIAPVFFYVHLFGKSHTEICIPIGAFFFNALSSYFALFSNSGPMSWSHANLSFTFNACTYEMKQRSQTLSYCKQIGTQHNLPFIITEQFCTLVGWMKGRWENTVIIRQDEKRFCSSF